MTTPKPEIVLGGGEFGAPRLPDAQSTKESCDLFRAHGGKTIDVAPFYPALHHDKAGRTEELMAEASVTEWATIDTKIVVRRPQAYSEANITDSLEGSLKRLGGGDGSKKNIHTLFISALP
jgi:aryl-alcohol dehydrogenase-like predicted oxidoreductase